MTLEELQQQVNKDFKLDDTELDSESVSIPLLHNKYLIHFNKFSLLLIAIRAYSIVYSSTKYNICF